MKPRINDQIVRKYSERGILFMKDNVLDNMCLIQRIPEATFDPEGKYWQRLHEEMRTFSRPCQNTDLSEMLAGNWKGLYASNLVNRLAAPKGEVGELQPSAPKS